MKLIHSTLTSAGILFLSFYADAQKLPNIQKLSVWAPQNIKVDGQASEWNDKYQAYNNATNVNYTLSNDDKNLYLIIKAEGRFSISGKILAAGISFTANRTRSKKDAAAVTVTYPVRQGNDWGLLSVLFDGVSGMNMESNRGGDNSLVRLNKTFTEKAKFIGIAGIKDVAEKEISIYNNLNIQVSSAFHAPAIYVYELAIPLALLALPEGGTQAFSYHIKLNVPQGLANQFHGGAPISTENSNLAPPPSPAPQFTTPTDFWGEYTLAKSYSN